MSYIEAGAFAAARVVDLPLADCCVSRLALACDVRACVWSIAREHGIPAQSLAATAIMGKTWNRKTIRDELERLAAHGYRIVADWQAARMAARRAMFPGSIAGKAPASERPTLDETIATYLADAWGRHGTLVGVATEAGITRHVARRLLAKYGLHEARRC